jgi:hypothetical protein
MSEQNQILNPCGCCEGIESLTPVRVENLPGLSALSFRAGTYASFKMTMLSALSKHAPLRDLGTRDDDDPTIALCDAWATVLDVLAFYQERIANEGYLRTATERRSVLEIARSIGYELDPGVAASTYLAFALETAPGAPPSAKIGVGTKVQSVPGQDELPQTFETTEEIEAWATWSRLKPQLRKKEIPAFGSKEVYLDGITTELKPGDGLLMIGADRQAKEGSERWDFRRITTVTTDRDTDFTKVTWERGLGWQMFSRKILPAEKDFQVLALRQRAFLFGYNAPDWRTLSDEVRGRYLGGGEGGEAASIADTETEWKNFNIAHISGDPDADPIETIFLDALYPKIVQGSWLVLARPSKVEIDESDSAKSERKVQKPYVEVYEVLAAEESSRSDFTLNAKTTAVRLDGENLRDKFNDTVRETVVFAESEELEIAEYPVTAPVEGSEITLEERLPELPEKRIIIISGKRRRVQIVESFRRRVLTSEDGSRTVPMDMEDTYIVVKRPELRDDGKTTWTLMDMNGFIGTVVARASKFASIPAKEDDALTSEVATIDKVDRESDPTVITLLSALTNSYDRSTVVIHANVAKATHGETRKETLGSADASRTFQKFELKQKPLTYVSAPTPSGGKSTLEVRVNDLLWNEAATLHGLSPEKRSYVTRIADDGTVTVRFGDGKTGMRPPTGIENVSATYRVGTGLNGMLKERQIKTLPTQILGVKEAINPLAPTGAADPERLEDARSNAPLTVLTLDRVVSLQDFEDFANAFSGIGKAQANVVWDGEQRVIHVTVAGADGGDVSSDSELHKNLIAGLQAARHSDHRIVVESYEALTFNVKAGLWVHGDYIVEDVKAEVEAALVDAFSFERRAFGQAVTKSETMAIIQSVKGVVAVDLDELHMSSEPAPGVPHNRLPVNMFEWEVDLAKPAKLLTLNPQGITLLEKK